ncbi:MAG: MoaD/ThiS family protein [Nocardioidaceae bacterium]
MDPSATAATPRNGADPAPVVTVRYWAAARAAAGCGEEQVRGATVSEVLAAVRAGHSANARFEQVLKVSSLLLGEQPLGVGDLSQVAVADGDVLEVLPPFAGGARP